MTHTHPTALVYRDPLCHIQDPEHRCRRRDGRLLTNPYDGFAAVNLDAEVVA